MFTFKAESHGNSWMPLGRDENDNEVWCDGCCVTDQRLDERIAANMQAAYNKGLEDAARETVQTAIAIAKKGGGAISNTTSSGYWLVKEEQQKT